MTVTTSYRKSGDKTANGICSLCKTISNGDRTEWSPIRSVIIQVMTKSDDREAGVRFVGRHEVLLQINHENNNFQEKKNNLVMKERENLHEILTKET